MSIDYYVSMQSPWTFLGHERLVRYAAKSNTPLAVYPIDFSKVFPATGGLPLPKRSDERKAYRLAELARWRRRLDLKINLEPRYFPAQERLASLCVVALLQLLKGEGAEHAALADQKAVSFVGKVLAAVWQDEQNIADSDVLAALLSSLQIDANAVLDLAQQTETAERYEANSKNAIARGVFGAPSYVINDAEGEEIFWGQDRLTFLAERLGVAE